MDHITQFLQRFLKDEDGASAVEYGLIIGLIAVALIVVLGLLGGGLEGLFDAVVDELPAVGGGS
jgi:pilus assembly protein Flp/PilA